MRILAIRLRGTGAMPALTVAGYKWHIASDDVPLFASFGAVFHAVWVGVILLTSQSILNMPDYCHHAGLQYIITVFGLLLCFASGFITEILLIWEGCKGLLLSTSAQPVVFLRIAYQTYVAMALLSGFVIEGIIVPDQW